MIIWKLDGTIEATSRIRCTCCGEIVDLYIGMEGKELVLYTTFYSLKRPPENIANRSKVLAQYTWGMGEPDITPFITVAEDYIQSSLPCFSPECHGMSGPGNHSPRYESIQDLVE